MHVASTTNLSEACSVPIAVSAICLYLFVESARGRWIRAGLEVTERESRVTADDGSEDADG